METVDDFYEWEAEVPDTMDVKRIYIDLAGSLAAGLILSQLIYWSLPKNDRTMRLQVKRHGHYWLAKARHTWWDECRVTVRQADLALHQLEARGLITTALFKFNGSPTKHVRLSDDFVSKLSEAIAHPPANPFLPKGANPSALDGELDVPEGTRSLTETTSEITSDSDTTASPSQAIASPSGGKKKFPPTSKKPSSDPEVAGEHEVTSNEVASNNRQMSALALRLQTEMESRGHTITRKSLGLLDQPIGDYPSPNESYRDDADYRQYVEAKITYHAASELSDKSSYLVNLIRCYTGDHGWPTYKRRLNVERAIERQQEATQGQHLAYMEMLRAQQLAQKEQTDVQAGN